MGGTDTARRDRIHLRSRSSRRGDGQAALEMCFDKVNTVEAQERDGAERCDYPHVGLLEDCPLCLVPHD